MLSWELRFALINWIFWLSTLVLQIDLKIKNKYVTVTISGTVKLLCSLHIFFYTEMHKNVLFSNEAFYLLYLFIYFIKLI